ncbi:hypothetical protein HU200_002419 [Digitaria exilis]|uniref:Rx N-terminal domain-containing protein n=1 Tax=Digitaria exilis TaxID=1010633 RepID=A0A835FWX7_9POAL|nr:hypothetical protein HU200_002419 [Digitaria exilis]
METAITAVAGELLSRFISFTINKFCSSYVCSEKEERLQHLLMRAHTVVEEADGRHISNSGMLMQLKALSEAMYQGYHALDTLRFQLHDESCMNKVSDSFSISSTTTRLKRRRTILSSVNKGKALDLDVHGALKILETVISNIAEFVVLLGGCERMSRRPYDAYLYIGNNMFGRHVEKQKLLNFLLQHNPHDAPAVLPIIGGVAVGKKTLVAHVCTYESIRSQFPSILHLNGDNFLTIVDHENVMLGMTLVVVEFVSDVDDVEWEELYSFVARTNKRTKVIIISKLQRLERFGSVRPIFLNTLSYEELWYLFKALAFGPADPTEHPRLVHIAEGFVKELHQNGSLVAANALAYVLRRNMNDQLWLCILNRCKKVIEKNLFASGQHPKLLLEQGHEIDVTDFASSPVSSLCIIPCTGSSSVTHPPEKELPQVTLEELLLDPCITPKGQFKLLSWESRLPPYTSFIHFVPKCTEDTPEGTHLSRRKRRGVDF